MHNHAESDLEAIWDHDQDSATLIVVILEELEVGGSMAQDLVRNKFRNYAVDPSYEIKRFAAFWRDSQTVYILKFWDYDGGLVPYRIIYAHHPQQDLVHVLAIIHRNVDYENDHSIIARVRADYERLAIPSHRS